MDLQFYPIPLALALRAIKKFQSNSIARLLEPSAGRGDFLDAVQQEYGKRVPIDCIEIDFENQAVLRSKGHRVVGHDFLKFSGASLYSHILMNPPFAFGAQHTLHAWDLLVDGEISSIINAETIKNPYSKERQQLVRLIEDHGSVEFVNEAFMDPDTKRKAAVEVAIVYLSKSANFKAEFLDKLKKDRFEFEEESVDASHCNDVILPQSKISNLVIAFNCAVEAKKEAVFAEVRASYYGSWLGESITASPEEKEERMHFKKAAEMLNEAYVTLKERAWSTVLRSTTVTSRLSSEAQKRLERDFENISQLEFTAENIHGFLLGLVEQQGEIQQEMIVDAFDMISRYHPENRAYYQGWKSNAKHRVNAFRIMMTRFILPSSGSGYDSWNRSLDWYDRQKMADLDKVFSMLDGKNHEGIYGLNALFDDRFADLSRGERLSCDYFEMRFYPRAGTFHFFPTRKDLIDRLNRIVGQHRQWIPMDARETKPGFWEQFEEAEKVTRKMSVKHIHEWRLRHGSETEKAMEEEKLFQAHQEALAAVGIEYDPNSLIENEAQRALPLLDHLEEVA